MEATEVIVNWFFSPQENSEGYERIGVGAINGEGHMCTKIEIHAAQGEGDRFYADCYFADGSMSRYFNLNNIKFNP